jgi:hypothetical protein
MDSEEWALFASWMSENGLIGDVPDTSEILTNEVLPAAK